MRYLLSTALVCLTLLALPGLLPGPDGQPRISPQRAVESPLAYAAAFQALYRPWLERLPGQPPSTEPPADGIHRWVDAEGVTHFSDAPPGTPAHQPLVFLALLLAVACLLTLLTVALADMTIRTGQRLSLALRDRLQRDRADDPRPALLAPIHFDGSAPDDPYQVLGISPKASDRNVRAAYQRLQERYAPANCLHLEPSAQEAARHKAAAIASAWQQIREERGLND